MKSQSFVKLLRKVIREEVRSAIKEVLTEQNQVTDHGTKLTEIAGKPNPYSPIAGKKTYVKNNMLNDLLNETAAATPSQELTDWSKMDFRSEMAESFGASRKESAIAQSMTSTLATHDTNGKPVDMNNESVAKTVNLMTKDYTALMKAIDKKKGKK